jgi:hypothetical protein
MLRSVFGFACLAGAAGLLAASAAAQEFRVNQYTTNVQRPTSVALTPDGSFVVVWSSNTQDGHLEGIFRRTYDAAGNPTTSEFQVNQYTTGSQRDASVDMGADGGFVVSWSSVNQDGNNNVGIIGRLFDSAGGAQGPEFVMNSIIVGPQERPSVAMAAGGSFVGVWEGPDPTPSVGVWGRRFSSAGIAIGLDFRINEVTTNHQRRVRVAAAADGRFVAVWDSVNQDGNNNLGIFARRFDASGNPIAGEFQVNTFTTDSQTYPAVSMASDGSFVVVWMSYFQDGDHFGVFGQRYDNTGTKRGAEFQANTVVGFAQGRPGVALADDGSFVVAWHSYFADGYSNSIRAQRYDAQGNPTGGEFGVNTYTSGFQGIPFISGTPNGSFVVVWESRGQDGGLGTAMGRHFPVGDLIFADGFES